MGYFIVITAHFISYYNFMSSRCSRKAEKADKIPNNNINININFSMKEKTNCYVGKKIDNFVEVSRGRPQRNDIQRPNFTAETLKQKKKALEQARQTEMKRKKAPKNYQFTPQKHCNRYGEERSRSKSHKGFGQLVKKRAGKSMECMRDRRDRDDSSASVSKSRSRSGERSLKNLRKNKRGSKASLGFQNSGIKKRLEEDQLKRVKGTKSSTAQRLQEQDSSHVRTFMNEKKEKERKQKEKNKKVDKAKTLKIKEQLKKVEEKRKRNGSKKEKIEIPQPKKRQKSSSHHRLPLFFDEQNLDEEQEYSRLTKEAEKLVHEQQQRDRKREIHIKEGNKLLSHFQAGKLTRKEETKLNGLTTTIQKMIRAYLVRKRFSDQLNLRQESIDIMRGQLKFKDSPYWNQDSNSNSIVKIDGSNPSRQEPESSDISMAEEYGQIELIQSNNSIRVEEELIKAQISELARNLEEQNQRYRRLEEENQRLKAIVVVQQNKEKRKLEIQPEMVKSDMEISQKFQVSGENALNLNPSTNSQQEPIPSISQQLSAQKEGDEDQIKLEEVENIKKELSINTEDMQYYKKIVKSYSCSPKSMSASRIKEPSIMEIFHKKQLRLEDKFQKKNQEFQRLLHEHLVSPRTYNMKIISLEKHYQKEREVIMTHMDQAKRVAEYINSMDEDEKELSSSSHSQKDKSDQMENDSDNNDRPNNQKWLPAIEKIDQDANLLQSKQDPADSEIPEDIDPRDDESRAMAIFDKIIKANNDLGESSQQPAQSADNEPKGFETNLTFIKEYCIGLCQYIRAHDHLRQDFWTNISNPITYDNFQLLKAYRTTMDHENSSVYNSHKKDFLYPFFKSIVPRIQAIPHEVFEEFNDTYDRLTTNFEMKHLEQCYLESVLDAFNEALDYERPGSIFGEQIPWNTNSRHLKNYGTADFQQGMGEEVEEQKFDQFFGVAIARLIQWGSCLCGFIPESLELESNQKIEFDDQQINHVRETRMALMLEKAIKEDDDTMVNSELEQTEIRLSVAQIIFEDLVAEAIKDCEVFY